MGKPRNKRKSGSFKSQTIIILTIIICVFIVLIFRPGIIAAILNPLMSAILIISVLINAFLIYKLLNKEKKTNSNYTTERTKTSRESEFNEQKVIKTLSKERELLIRKVRERDTIISQLETKTVSLETTINTLNSEQKLIESNVAPPNRTQTVTVEPEPEVVKTPEATPRKQFPKKNSLFFDGPYDDRLFSEDKAAQEKRFRYVYRIEYATAEPSVGQLFLEPTAEEYDILRSYSDTVLKPACAFENAFYTSFHNISQLAPGVVHKQGNDWFVKEKVKIRFN